MTADKVQGWVDLGFSIDGTVNLKSMRAVKGGAKWGSVTGGAALDALDVKSIADYVSNNASVDRFDSAEAAREAARWSLDPVFGYNPY